jgi:predicted flap endonuclease-1-like 5' DNA nuclease
MTFDTLTIVVSALVVLGLAIMIWGLASRRKAPPAARALGEDGSPYVASRERPYVKPPPREGAGIADEAAHATTDVAGAVLGIAVKHAPEEPADDLQLLKGVGPKFVARLNELGITRFDQLAGLNPNEAAHLDERMGPFQGRIARDRVIEQADYLARGDTDGFEEKFGKLGG